MGKVAVNAKLMAVKLALAEKYEHLAAVVKSKPRRAVWLRMAEKHRRQARRPPARRGTGLSRAGFVPSSRASRRVYPSGCAERSVPRLCQPCWPARAAVVAKRPRATFETRLRPYLALRMSNSLQSPTDLFQFFAWLKKASETRWATVEINRSVYGFQVQPGTEWLPGISDSEIAAYEAALGFSFPAILRTFLRNMNGTSKEAINVYGDNGEPWPYVPGYYSFPRDLDVVKVRIRWIYDSFGVDGQYVECEQISHVVPVVGHRFLVADRCAQNPVLSMFGDDVIVYARDLRVFLINDIFADHVRDAEGAGGVKVKFWVNDA